eukprot:650695-Rhodomonas_salina.1
METDEGERETMEMERALDAEDEAHTGPDGHSEGEAWAAEMEWCAEEAAYQQEALDRCGEEGEYWEESQETGIP